MKPGASQVPAESRVLPVESRGRTLPVSCLHRPGTGEALLYLHGLGCTKEDFLGAWDVAGWESCTLLAFDAPGCGETRGYRHGLPLGVDDIVDVAGALVEHLGLDGLTVVGHSMGGLAALLLALRHRSAVRRLVSVEGNLGPEDCALYSRRVFRRRSLGVEEAFMADLARELAGSGAPGFDRAAGVLRENVQTPAFFDYCRSIVGYSDHHPLLDDFLALDLPRLYVHGAANAYLSCIPRLVEGGVAVRSIPGSDHFPAWSNPRAYYDALAGFTSTPRADR